MDQQTLINLYSYYEDMERRSKNRHKKKQFKILKNSIARELMET